jgi:formamidopyrimidine-DNA glycosylase
VPELPEVETTRRGIEPHLVGKKIREIIVRRRDLRLPIPESLAEAEGHKAVSIRRRSKYLILDLDNGSSILIHLGMSGSLRIASPSEPAKTHDHVLIGLSSGKQLRFHDPRRFGIVLHLPQGDPLEHPLFKGLGPEPLEEAFTSDVLAKALSKRAIPVKVALMDAKTVVGVGNIYASEALFRAKILPATPANKLSKVRTIRLTAAIKEVLEDSITQGGTTLRDFLHSDGKPGYFSQRLFVYDRKGEPCRVCGTPIRQSVMAQRSTFWCPKCQR